MKNTLANHLKKFGEQGALSWNAGRDVNVTTFDDIAQLVQSKKDNISYGYVYIVGTNIQLRIISCNGDFLELESYGDKGWKAFEEVSPKYGTYAYGKIRIYYLNVIKAL